MGAAQAASLGYRSHVRASFVYSTVCPKALRSERAPSARPNRRFSDCSQICLSWRTTARSERCSFNFGIAILIIWSAVGVQFRYLWVQSERNPNVLECNLSAALVFESAI